MELEFTFFTPESKACQEGHLSSGWLRHNLSIYTSQLSLQLQMMLLGKSEGECIWAKLFGVVVSSQYGNCHNLGWDDKKSNYEPSCLSSSGSSARAGAR